MILEHARLERAGIEVHAWASAAGVAALHLGAVPPVACVAGSQPVAGIQIDSPGETLVDLVAALESYFDGEPLVWSGALDRRAVPDFARRVFDAVSAVPWGEVTTYGAIARGISMPRAGRAVGQALHRNPFPLIVPCHRVLQEGGRLGGFAGGAAMKRRLLDLEAGQRALEFPEAP